MSQEEIAQKVKEAIKKDPNKNYIQSISLFGSHLYGNAKKDSDIDLLFEMREVMSLFQIVDVKTNLEKKLGRKIDFVSKGSVIPQLRDKIIPQAKKIYERK